MKNGSDNFKNEHGFEFLSYIYGELDDAGQDAFEFHLATCDECVVEMASYSDARLGVIEWRREDFDHLETPAIIVPWANEKETAVSAGSAGIFTNFVEALRAFPMFAKAGIGLAAAALAIGVFYLASSSPASKPAEVAANKNVEQPASKNQTLVQTEAPRYVASSNSGLDSTKPKNTINRPESSRPVVAVRASVHPTVRRNELATNVVNKTNVTTAKKAPRLTTGEDEEDKSLRLADLFAEIGSSEE